MPIYEYLCIKCGLKFDYLVRASQETAACLRCKNKDLKRLVSAFSFSSKDKQGNIAAGSSSGCSSCSSRNCSTCAG